MYRAVLALSEGARVEGLDGAQLRKALDLTASCACAVELLRTRRLHVGAVFQGGWQATRVACILMTRFEHGYGMGWLAVQWQHPHVLNPDPRPPTPQLAGRVPHPALSIPVPCSTGVLPGTYKLYWRMKMLRGANVPNPLCVEARITSARDCSTLAPRPLVRTVKGSGVLSYTVRRASQAKLSDPLLASHTACHSLWPCAALAGRLHPAVQDGFAGRAQAAADGQEPGRVVPAQILQAGGEGRAGALLLLLLWLHAAAAAGSVCGPRGMPGAIAHVPGEQEHRR